MHRTCKTGPFQFVSVHNKATTIFLKAFCRNAFQGDLKARIFSVSYNQYSQHLRNSTTVLDLEKCRFTTRSAQIGGAVCDYINGKSAENRTLEITLKSAVIALKWSVVVGETTTF